MCSKNWFFNLCFLSNLKLYMQWSAGIGDELPNLLQMHLKMMSCQASLLSQLLMEWRSGLRPAQAKSWDLLASVRQVRPPVDYPEKLQLIFLGGGGIRVWTQSLHLFFFSFIHMCIHYLGHFSSLSSLLPPSLSGRICSALTSNFVEERV
jgi:hypothetical protein